MPDANILTLTETLDAVRRICDAVDIPVIADCDNGYGNAINVMRTVTEFERAGAAGICIEDNEFPKRCSFYAGVRRDLVAPEEHARKIEAAVAARRSSDFVVIARTEALIAGLGLDEAMLRARAYADAGADAVLVHSKAATSASCAEFGARWDSPTCRWSPCPTTYPGRRRSRSSPRRASGWRSSRTSRCAPRSSRCATRCARMRETRPIAAVEDDIVPLEEVYRLVGVPELKANEKRFLFAGAGAADAPSSSRPAPSRRLLPLDQDRAATSCST